jgi:1-acyl-sn-glycerol-3-phosphate acyltransferase
MHALRVFFKLLIGIGHLLRGMWTIATKFGKASSQQRAEHIADWAIGLLRLLNVQLLVEGQAVKQGPLLVVANHISWLDILVLLAAQPVCFVSKSEVKRWPVIGWLATNVGTLYIERTSRRDAMRVVHRIAEGLQQGQIVVVFPEGTTTDGAQVLPFHANLLQAAVAVHAPVQPVVLRFVDEATGLRSMSPVYVDDDTLLRSVWRMLSSPPVQAHLKFLQTVPTQGTDRRQLAQDLQQRIATQLAQASTEKTKQA